MQVFVQPRALVVMDWGWNSLGVEQNDVRDPLLYSIDQEGKLDRFPFTIPGAGFIRVYSIAAGPEGSLAVSGSAYDADGRAGTFVARIAPDRKSQTVTRTWPYVPDVITLAPDGTVWAAGWVLQEETNEPTLFNVIKHFDSSGKVLGTLVLPARGIPSYRRNGVSYSRLKASRDRLAGSLGAWSTLKSHLTPVNWADLRARR